MQCEEEEKAQPRQEYNLDGSPTQENVRLFSMQGKEQGKVFYTHADTTPRDVILSKTSPNGRRFLIGGASSINTRLRFVAEPIAGSQSQSNVENDTTILLQHIYK